MWPNLTLVTAVALAGPATALLVAPGSPCEQYCGNVLSTTTGADMTCQDSDYAASSAGIVFETCIGCELKSAYSSGNTSDLNYLLYNLRYTISYCLFGLENSTDAAGSPCIIEPACGLLEDAFNYDNMTVDVGSYDFCQDWVENQVPKCTACLSSSSTFMENYVTILDAACRQMPNDGSTLSVQGTPFSTIPMNVTTPSATPLYTYTPTYSPISLGGKVGIAVGGLVLILSIAGFLIVFFGRRRRRAFLKGVEARYGGGGHHGGGVMGGRGGDGWPSPDMAQMARNAHDKYSTPTSTQPLRGWDDTSPISVATTAEKNGNGYFPRYFSPYNSQYNSPVSAEDGPPYTTWPAMASMTDTLGISGNKPATGGGSRHYQVGLRSVSPVDDGAHDGSPGSSKGALDQRQWQAAYTQEEIDRMAHEYELAQIGVALGGTDPSLRSKNSNMSMEAGSSSSAAAARITDFPMPLQQQQLHSQAQAAFHQASVHGESSSSSLSSLSISPGVLWEPSSSSSSRRNKRSKKSSGPYSEPSDSEDIILTTMRRPSAYERAQAQAQAEAEAQVQAPSSTLQQSPRPMQYYPRPPSPEMESPYGGLTEADARHGRAM
ncbi:hypothetical protein SCUCBS95973_005359 [Sporothrix curviconia]|uniref:Lpxtg-domain-containing protein n=1 Tax=Sporothrix curviconia TaxID=1260050 RepID=A0ABP0BWL2_9PEZI